MPRILHLGCGRKQWDAPELLRYCGLGVTLADDTVATHLDRDPTVAPDIVCDLGREPIPLPDNSVDIVIAWHVLEHIGRQGESAEWFRAIEEIYRVLVPNGWLYGESPYYTSIWAWSDPTHTRALSEHSFVFFAQDSYRKPESAISPYRIACDFGWLSLGGMERGYRAMSWPDDPRVISLRFCLVALKPLKPWWLDGPANAE